ncbi:MAG: serine/threonine-protein kinase [Pseudomonadota bacterium]
MSQSPAKCRACGADLLEGAKFCTQCGEPVVSRPAPPPNPTSIVTIPPKHEDDDDDPKPKRNAGPGLEAGDVVADKYVIEGVIGQGGMGTVFKAREKLTDKPVALKIIRSENVANQSQVQQLISEGTTTRDLAHPNIVRVYEIGLHGDQPFMAMEYIQGKPLHVWRTEQMTKNTGNEVPVFVVGQIMKAVLNGLEAAHSAGVIHRDLKPENILLIGEPTSKSANVKIVDFGIALGAEMPSGTVSSTGVGTQLYMAPEQIRNADLATPAADLFAVSKIFYELLIGVLPTGHWQPPSGARKDVPRAIDRLIELGLKDAPSARPQSAAEYRTLLVQGMNADTEYNPVVEKVFDRLDQHSWLNIDRNDPKVRRYVLWSLIGLVVVFIIAALDEWGAVL